MKQPLHCSQEEFILSDVAAPPLSRFQAAGVFTLLRGGEKQGVSLLYYITCIHAYRALLCVIV